MSKINLTNNHVRKFIRQFLDIEIYGEPFATLVEETFVREQYVLSLTPEELKEDLNNFKNSVKSIRWGNLDKSNVMGQYQPYDKSIVFNANYWNDIFRRYGNEVAIIKFYETFSHEALHGMQQLANGTNRAGGYNNVTKNRAHALYEIGTQAIAAKIANNRNINEFSNNKVLTGDGYSNEIFAVPLLASAFGVSEQEVLKNLVRTRDDLITALDKNINNRNYTAQLVQSIEDKLEEMHSVNYPDSNQHKYISMNKEQKKEANTRIMKGIVKDCQLAFSTRLLNISADLPKEDLIQFQYDYKKMYGTVTDTMVSFSNLYNKKPIELVREMHNTEWGQHIDYADSMFESIKNNHLNAAIRAPELIATLKQRNYGLLKRMGISKDSNSRVTDVWSNVGAFYEKVFHTDYNDFLDWDNTQIINVLNGNNRTDTNKVQRPQGQITDYSSPEIQNKINQKYSVLKDVLRQNSLAYGYESSSILLEFLNSDTMENLYYETREDDQTIMFDSKKYFYDKITRKGNARNKFAKDFITNEDKEILAIMMVSCFLEKYFDGERPIPVETIEEYNLQKAMLATVQKYDKAQLNYAFVNALVYDNYQGFTGNDKVNIALFGKKKLFEHISKPLIDEILEKRTLPKDKIAGLRDAAVYTANNHSNRHPGDFLATFLNEYKTKKVLNYRCFSRNTNAPKGHERDYIINQFGTDNRFFKDIIGFLCDEYFEYHKTHGIPSYYSNYINNLIEQNGKAKFKEEFIKYIFDDNSHALNEQFRIIPLDDLSKEIVTPFIQRSKEIVRFDGYKDPTLPQNYVSMQEVGGIAQEIAKETPLGKFNAFRRRFNNKERGIF